MRFRVRDVLAVLWMLGVAVALLAPAWLHGHSIGPFDLLTQHGLTKKSGVVIHNFTEGDQIDEMIPWSALAWTQVHHGHLPLWNPYSGFGMPLAFNWQSAPFSVPALVGYLVPVRFSYTVGLLTTLFVAGTGAYVLGRVLRLSLLASVMAGTVFELSGPLTGWLGFPHASVASWTGWLFAAALLIVRGRRRARCIALFAVVLALAVYAGQPEVLTVVILSLLVFLVVLLAPRAAGLWGSGPLRRPIVDLLLAAVAGGALAAPLALPGLQLASQSVRSISPSSQALRLHDVLYVLFQGFDGLPIAGNQPFGESFFYNETSAYVGLIALVLAVVGIAVRRRRPEVISLTAVGVVTALLAYSSPVVSFMGGLPFVGKVAWLRALMPMALVIAVLAGLGLDALIRSYSDRSVRRWAVGTFATAGVVLLAIWLFGRGNLPPSQADIRSKSFIWPVVETGLGLAVVGSLSLVVRARLGRGAAFSGVGRGWRGATARDQADTPGAPKRSPGWRLGAGQWAGLSLLACETAFLVTAGAPLWSSSSQFLTPTPAVASVKRVVGDATVGSGGGLCGSVGILPEANVGFDVHELDVYDPIIPKAYFKSLQASTGQASLTLFNEYCPSVKTASVARLYGVEFVLEGRGAPGPQGGVFVSRVGDEDLYRIPGAAPATITPLPASGRLPSNFVPGAPVGVTHPSPSVWNLTTRSATEAVLRLRLTDVPGWHATLDGRPLHLQQFSGVMLQALVPPGRHSVELHYWPTTFTAGIVLAACSVVALISVPLVARARHRQRGQRMADRG